MKANELFLMTAQQWEVPFFILCGVVAAVGLFFFYKSFIAPKGKK